MSEELKDASLAPRHFFASSQGPFYGANNVLMFFGGADRGAILDTLVRRIGAGESRLNVLGEAGIGKTMLSLVLAERLSRRYNIIRYDHPELSRELLLRYLCVEICPRHEGVAVRLAEPASAQHHVDSARNEIDTLKWNLQQASPGNKPLVLIIDSAAEPDDGVDQLLADLDTVRRLDQPALHVVMFRLSNQTVNASTAHGEASDVSLDYHLRRLKWSEVSDFLKHHMLMFDYNRRNAFTREMSYLLADSSNGVPRQIKNLARTALQIASVQGEDRLSVSHLLMATRPPRTDSGGAVQGFVRRHRAGLIAMCGMGVVGLLAATVFNLT